MDVSATKGVLQETGEPQLKKRLQGLLLFRLLLAFFFLLLTLGVQGYRGEDLLESRLLPLYFFSCILFLFTIVAAATLKYSGRLKRFARLQVAFDIVAVTVLIYLSGGVDSIFSFLYMLVIIASALLLYRRGSFFTASFCSLAYGALLDLQYFGWISPLQVVTPAIQLSDGGVYFQNILTKVAGFYLVAYLSGYLSEELQKSSLQVKKQGKDLRRLEALHRDIVQSMSSGLLTVDLDGTVLFANRSACEILGLERDIPANHSLAALLPIPESHLFGGESPNSIDRPELVHVRPDGETIHLGYTTSVLNGSEGEPSGRIILFQDLTRLKVMEAHVRRMEHLAFAGKIAAEIAHEIKNPLAAMSGAAQMLQGESTAGTLQARLLDIVCREIGRIDELVADFLWLARGAHRTGKVEEVPVRAVIQENLALIGSGSRFSGKHRTHAVFDSSPVLLMDPHHLRRVFWNLLVNAVEAMPDGGDLGVRVIGLDNGGVRVDVTDSGCGISAGDAGKVFEPFFTTKNGGTGLGLSIAYQLMEHAGGRIELTRSDADGTTFSLFFPPRLVIHPCQAAGK